jgi:hypothetical protein
MAPPAEWKSVTRKAPAILPVNSSQRAGKRRDGTWVERSNRHGAPAGPGLILRRPRRSNREDAFFWIRIREPEQAIACLRPVCSTSVHSHNA